MSNKIQPIETPPKMVNEPGFGLPNRDIRATIAVNLQRHLKGMVAGKKGTMGTSKTWDKGDLNFEEALYVVDYAITQGLNPFTDVHVWFFKSLQVTPHYKILVGWANLREPFDATYRAVTEPDERAKHGLKEGDIGAVCYILKKSDKPRWDSIYKTVITAQIESGVPIDTEQARRAANDAICVQAVGIVLSEEMTDKEGNAKQIQVTGWSWMQRAETRALRNALARSHGQPTPAEIQAYSKQLHGGTIKPEILADEGYQPELGQDDVQLKQIETAKNGSKLFAGISDKERVALMRGNEEESWVAVEDEPIIFENEPEPEPEPEPKPKAKNEPEPPMNPKALLEWANTVSATPFNNVSEITTGIRSVSGDDWQFPKANDKAGWKQAQSALLEFISTNGAL